MAKEKINSKDKKNTATVNTTVQSSNIKKSYLLSRGDNSINPFFIIVTMPKNIPINFLEANKNDLLAAGNEKFNQCFQLVTGQNWPDCIDLKSEKDRYFEINKTKRFIKLNGTAVDKEKSKLPKAACLAIVSEDKTDEDTTKRLGIIACSDNGKIIYITTDEYATWANNKVKFWNLAQTNYIQLLENEDIPIVISKKETEVKTKEEPQEEKPLFGTAKEFFMEGSFNNKFINNLWSIYRPYYEESRPAGILKEGVFLTFDKKYDNFSASSIYNKISRLDTKFSYIFVDDANDSLDFRNKNLCFYKLHEALARGTKDCGFEPLIRFIDKKMELDSKNSKPYIAGESDFKKFCKSYFYSILPKIYAKNGMKTLTDSKDELAGELILSNFYNFYMIDDINKGFYKFTIGNAETNWNKSGIYNTKFQDSIGLTYQSIATHGDGDVTHAYCFKFATEDGVRLDLNTPMWAFKIADSIKRAGGINAAAIPLGKNIKDDKRVTIRLKDNSGWMINLIAGSGSGKGVTTMAIVGQAAAKRWPVLYLDCKPDMANSICRWGGVGIDGNKVVEENPVITQENLTEMASNLMKNSNTTIDKNDAEAICRAIIWTRAVEIFLHLQHIRAQFNNLDGLTTEEVQLVKEITNDKIRPLLVMDEFQAESFLIEGLVGATATRELQVSNGDNENGPIVRQVNQLSSTLIDIINNKCDSSNTIGRKYLLSIPKWINGVYGKKEPGLCGQVATAFGRQANAAIFTISQRFPKDGDMRYGATLEDTLKFYLGNYITIYGKDTDESGSSKFSGNKLFGNFMNPDKKLQRGEFCVKGPGSNVSGARIKTYLTLDDVADSTPNSKAMDNVANALNDDPDVAREVLEDVQDTDRKEEFMTKKIKERRIDTLEYVADSNEMTVDQVKANFAYSRDYFDKVCKFIYNKSFVGRLTDVSKDSFKNRLGIIERDVRLNKKLVDWEDLNKWAKIVYMAEHSDKYGEFLKNKEESERD